MHFGWKPLILWSLHLYDIYKLFLGKGCPSGQCVCSRFLNTFLYQYIKMNECWNQFLIQLKYPSVVLSKMSFKN